MPNNSSARREKDKKRKDKKRETVPPPLHKEDKASKLNNASSEDKASADSVSLSLSLTGIRTAPEIAVPRYAGDCSDVNSLKDDYFMMQFIQSFSLE
jgi:hypothetical protein